MTLERRRTPAASRLASIWKETRASFHGCSPCKGGWTSKSPASLCLGKRCARCGDAVQRFEFIQRNFAGTVLSDQSDDEGRLETRSNAQRIHQSRATVAGGGQAPDPVLVATGQGSNTESFQGSGRPTRPPKVQSLTQLVLPPVPRQCNKVARRGCIYIYTPLHWLLRFVHQSIHPG